ncbi:MAG: DUF7901 domain-containing protein, partial [Planctomycetota bacterium]
MITSKPVIVVFAMFLLVTSSAIADCNPNAVTKWVQLPDLTREGIDIRMDREPFNIRRTLADDFLCTETGLITCVRFWGSWFDDRTASPYKGTLQTIHLSIHSDVPAGTEPCYTFSHAGELLWEEEFDDTSFTETLYAELCPGVPPCNAEGFWDPSDTPNDPPYTPNADDRIWLYTVSIPPSDAFEQLGTPADPIVYWLDIYVEIVPDGIKRKFGWKTSPDNWNDDAVRDYDGINWAELIYPTGHPFDGNSIDLAFELFTDQIPTEACCYVNAAGIVECDDLTVAECLAKNGTPQGAGTDCATLDPCCPDPVIEGACCLPNGNCMVMTEGMCDQHDGIYQGDGTDCNLVQCPSGCIPDSKTCPNGEQSIASSYLAGLIDNFAPFPDPATPDAALAGYIATCTAAPGYALQFDELPGFGGVSANSWFGHTFTALPTNIVSATLEFRARATPGAGGGLAWNDTIGFVNLISGCTRTDLWINRFMNLPEAGGTWNAGQVATFCLDLDALPLSTGGTTSVISDLASGRLSVWAQDDTGIDYLLLNITTCPCEYPVEIVIPVEVIDDYNAPDTAPAAPSAEVTAAFACLKGFDDTKSNCSFAHTFTGLPSGIVGATLEIGLGAHADIPSNDTIALEFLNP